MPLLLRHLWQEMRSSFWFTPAIIVLGGVALAAGMIALDTTVDWSLVRRWPLLFGAGAEGSRGLLSAVAGSMITVAGVVFSITIVALSLTSNQYTPRVLRNFMRDGMNQTVLGVFVGIFAYCLVVLRTIQGGDESPFVPALSVLVGLLLAFVGIAFLIYFIHHISVSIQASSIIAAAANETIVAVDHLFPENIGDDFDEDAQSSVDIPQDSEWRAVPARRTGYIESIDGDLLIGWASERDAVLRMERGVGEFVVEGMPLLSVARMSSSLEDSKAELQACYVISRQPTTEQDAGFGIRQIVDIALKALSPGINDSTTAVTCVDYLTAILVRLVSRRIASPLRLEEGKLRLIVRAPNFEKLLSESFDQIRKNATGNANVLSRQLMALDTIASATENATRRHLLRQQANSVLAVAKRSLQREDEPMVDAAWERLLKTLQSEPGPPAPLYTLD